ncbi:MAG: glycosyltransferase family 39 protein [Candidatus Aminicenantaceae bacterium]
MKDTNHFFYLRWILFFSIVFAALGYLGYQAFFSPEIDFLRPSIRGKWIVYPEIPITLRGVRACPDVHFVKKFRLASVPDKYLVRFTVLRGYNAFINRQKLSPSVRKNWKKGMVYDLKPHLIKGENILRIRVFGKEGPPALLVEGPRAVRSGRQWKVAIGPEFKPLRKAALALRDESNLQGGLSPLRTSTKFPFYCAGLIVYILFILYALIPIRFKPWLNRPPSGFVEKEANTVVGAGEKEEKEEKEKDEKKDEKEKKRRSNFGFLAQHGFIILIFLVVAFVQLRNTMNYYYKRTPIDPAGHVSYVRHVAKHWSVPSAADGWEMFQPPLYYFLSAGVYRLFGDGPADSKSLKAVQIFTCLSGLGTIVIAWLLLFRLFPTQTLIRNLGFLFSAMLPMGFYMNIIISNEIFSGFVISLSMLMIIWLGFRDEFKLYHALIIGITLGLAMLSKYSGLFVLMSLLLLLALRWISRRASLKWMFLAALLPLCISGWMYIRNFQMYQDPFVGNWDKASGFHYEDIPGFRTLGFYTRFGQSLFQKLWRSRLDSFWDGKYASLWGDVGGTFLDPFDDQTHIWGTWILWLALLPSVAVVVGLFRALHFLLTREWDHPYLILALASFFIFIGVISFTMEVPFDVTIKAYLFLSLIPSLGVFAGLGLESLCRQLGKLRWLLYGNLAILFVLILYVYWYRQT